jgi:hypothetical protein
MAFPSESRSFSPEVPRIPHLARRRTEVGDLRHDVDEALLRLEAEVDGIAAPGNPATDVTTIQTVSVVAGAVNETIRVDPSLNPQTINLPEILLADSGRIIEIKEVGGSTAGSALANFVTVTPFGGNTVDGQADFQLSVERASVILRNDGSSDWMITGAYLPTTGGGGGALDHHQTDQYTAMALQTVFALTRVPADSADVVMHINGQRQRNGIDFTVIGTTITWLDVQFTLSGGDAVQLDFDF